MLSVVRGVEMFGIDQFYQALYRPDLVREKLAGDPDGKVRAAAAKLDLGKLVDSGRVPAVDRRVAQGTGHLADDLITVEARLADQGGGIGRAEWRINGVTVGVVEQTAATKASPSPSSKRWLWIPARTPSRSSPTTAPIWSPRSRRAPKSSGPAASPRRRRASMCWWSASTTTSMPLKLTYAVPDAKSLASALKDAGQGHYEDVIVTHVLDGDATAAKLDQVFTDLAAKVRPRDVFVFFAAGHGKTLDGRYYFIPQDLRYHTEQSLVRDAIGQDRLQVWFARILAKKAVLMFDTCEAGSLTERADSRRSRAEDGAGPADPGHRPRNPHGLQRHPGGLRGHGGHGVFTFSLLDALGRADTNGNGLVELTELIQHVDGLVPAITEKRWGAKQFPQMDAFGSNFSLARQVAALAPAQGEAIIVPIKPTHVSTELLQVFKEAGGTGDVVQQLPPFTTVTLVKSDQGWVLIARDGKLLGYAAEAKLHKLN